MNRHHVVNRNRVQGDDNIVTNYNLDQATEHQQRDESCGEIVCRVLVATSVAVVTEACLRHLVDRGCLLL
jgi:hypothetical protein